MPFCDITIFTVASDRKDAYLRFSERMARIYREFGASRVTDFWQDDDASADRYFHAEDAMATYATENLPKFRYVAGASDEEAVVVSITEWPDRATRDQGLVAVVSDPRVQATMTEEPIFDGGKMIAGGFTVALDVG